MTYNRKVIPYSMSPPWTFWDFGDAIEDWHQRLSEEAQYAFGSVLKNCAKVENHLDWVAFKRFLKGVSESIWELEFTADRCKYRVLGMFASGVATECWPKPLISIRKQAILLIGCHHKGRVYTPPDAIGTAERRAKLLKEGRGVLRERKINQNI